MDKGILWIAFIWVIAMIIIFGRKWAREKREMQISDEGMKKYRGKHFRKSGRWGVKL